MLCCDASVQVNSWESKRKVKTRKWEFRKRQAMSIYKENDCNREEVSEVRLEEP